MLNFFFLWVAPCIINIGWIRLSDTSLYGIHPTDQELNCLLNEYFMHLISRQTGKYNE